MNRDEMIERLVNFSVETALQNPQADWTRRILGKGFDGFRHMPSKKLERELQLRGLIGYEEPDDIPDDCAGCDESDGALKRHGRPAVLRRAAPRRLARAIWR